MSLDKGLCEFSNWCEDKKKKNSEKTVCEDEDGRYRFLVGEINNILVMTDFSNRLI